MDEKKIADLSNENFSKFAFESSQARLERIIKWLCIIIAILIIALIGSNAGWLYWESQWQYVKSTTEVSQELDSEGDAIINDGVHINEQSEADSKKNNDN